jgi:hypothetical protein
MVDEVKKADGLLMVRALEFVQKGMNLEMIVDQVRLEADHLLI